MLEAVPPDTLPLAVLGAGVDRRGRLAVIHPALPTHLLISGGEPAFHLSQPGLQTKARKDWDCAHRALGCEP